MFFKRKERKIDENLQKDHKLPIEWIADEYLFEAGKLIIEKNMASIGMLQRVFKIGFNRAVRIMEQLEQIGVVGEDQGTKPRKILVDMNEFVEIVNKFFTSNQNFANKDSQYQSKPIAAEERMNRYNHKFDYMTGEDFEVFVAQILKKIGFINIQLTKGSGDQGVDIIAERDSIKYAIQCKRYSQPVGNNAVQEVFAGKSFYHCHVGAVVTNNYFTKSAKELAKENGIVLWDRDFLNKNIDSKYLAITDEKIAPESIVEKTFKIDEDFVIFKYKNYKMLEIIGICNSTISAANLYLSLFAKLKDDWIGKYDFAVIIQYKEAMAVASNENMVDFFGGKEFNGQSVAGVPDWMNKARNELLNIGEYEFLKGIKEAHGYLDYFMGLVKKQNI